MYIPQVVLFDVPYNGLPIQPKKINVVWQLGGKLTQIKWYLLLEHVKLI